MPNSHPQDVPWLESVQCRGDAAGLSSLLRDESGRAIPTRDAWLKRREMLMREWIGEVVPWQVRPVKPGFEVLSEDREAGVVRQLIRYENEPGIFLEAYLVKPLKSLGKAPGFVVLHSTSDDTIRLVAGLCENQEEAFAVRLARAGAVSICPINMLWQGGPYADGKYDFARKTREELARCQGCTGSAKMLYDAQRALDVMLTLPEVDENRIGTVGHSLGAKEALYFAAFDPRVRAAVGHEGGLSLRASNWDASWYLGEKINKPGYRHEHHELLALIAPRPFLWVGGGDADGEATRRYFDAVTPVYELFGKPARVGQLMHHAGHTVPPEVSAKIEEWLLTYTR